MNLPDDIIARISPEPNSGCWLWMGAGNNTGYATLSIKHKSFTAHKFIYEILVGPVPNGLDLDHLCRVRCCVNPSHLEPVTRSENCNRGNTGHHMAALKAAITHCPNGHPYNAENTIFRSQYRSRPYRVCLVCRKEKGNKYYHDNSKRILEKLRAKYIKKADRK